MISSEVRTFLAEFIDSAESLDILMLIHAEPGADWTAETVSNRVFTVPQAATRRLEELKERGLLAEAPHRPGAYTAVIKDAQIRATLESVQTAYRENRADVINAVFSLKADPLKSFSNAFKLRSDS